MFLNLKAFDLVGLKEKFHKIPANFLQGDDELLLRDLLEQLKVFLVCSGAGPQPWPKKK